MQTLFFVSPENQQCRCTAELRNNRCLVSDSVNLVRSLWPKVEPSPLISVLWEMLSQKILEEVGCSNDLPGKAQTRWLIRLEEANWALQHLHVLTLACFLHWYYFFFALIFNTKKKQEICKYGRKRKLIFGSDSSHRSSGHFDEGNEVNN